METQFNPRPFSVGEAEQIDQDLKTRKSIKYSNVVHKTWKWQVMADNQIVEMQLYLNNDD